MTEITCNVCGEKFKTDNAFLANFGKGICPKPACQEALKADQAKREAEEQAEAQTARVEALTARMALPARYKSANLKNLNLPDRFIERAAAYISKPGGLFLYGLYGSGKTYLAAAIANAVVAEGRSVVFYSFPQLLQDIRESFNSSEKNEGDIIRRCQTANLFVLDDLGAEKQTDFTLDRLYLIIDHRYGNILPTIITSNLSIGEVARKVHERLASRFVEMCEIVKLPDKNLRFDRRA